MSIKNSKEKYGSVAITLHWSMALLMISEVILGFYMIGLHSGPEKNKLYGVHKGIGVCILMLVILRLLWRLRNISPPLPSHTPYWQKFAVESVHSLLYVMMFALPITGWLLSSAGGYPVSFFDLFILPKLIAPDKHLKIIFSTAHEWLAFGLIGLLILHAGAVLQHYIFYKYNILKRILP